MTGLIRKGERDKPSLKLMIPFRIFKFVANLDEDLMPADYEYYKDREDYYYESSIPFYQKFISKRVANKIINAFD